MMRCRRRAADDVRGVARQACTGGGSLFLAETLQVPVDVNEHFAQHEAQRHEVDLDEAQARVLRVHYHEKHQHDQLQVSLEQQPHPAHVDGQRDGRARDHGERAEP